MIVSKNATGTTEERRQFSARLFKSIHTANNIMNVLFTCHNLRRQQARLSKSNLIEKSASTDFKVTLDEGETIIIRQGALNMWDREVNALGFKYGSTVDEDNAWIGTIGPFMDFFLSMLR